MTLDEVWRATLYAWCESAANAAIDSWNQDPTRPIYLWYKPSNGAEWGKVRACFDPPGPDWKLASTERLSLGHRDYWHLHETIRAIVFSLPILPTLLEGS